ncbi:MAG: PadR family transcriptional regulator [Coriobacteriia bacterium]
MSLSYAILGFLNREPMTGYDLKTRCFDDTASHFWNADQAQIYRTLERLEAKGLVTSDVKVQFGRPDRKVYEVTHKGREALKEWLAQPRPMPPVRDPQLAQLFFSGALPDEDVIALLTSAREEHQGRLERLRAESRRVSASLHPHARSKRDAVLHGMTLAAAVARERATVDWLDDCLETATAGIPGSPDRTGMAGR